MGVKRLIPSKTMSMHITAAKNQWTDLAVMRNLLDNLQDVVVGRGKEFLAQACPFLGDASEFLPSSVTKEIPPVHFPFKVQTALSCPSIKLNFPPMEKNFCLNPPMTLVFLVKNTALRKEKDTLA